MALGYTGVALAPHTVRSLRRSEVKALALLIGIFFVRILRKKLYKNLAISKKACTFASLFRGKHNNKTMMIR